MEPQIRIRMYRTGFGDCFLLSFDLDETPYHVLIDFGAHISGDAKTMDRIMDNIEQTTAGELEVIVASHAHRDHISGFGEFADRFAVFSRIGEVWLPWTDNPNDKEAVQFNRKQFTLYEALYASPKFSASPRGNPEHAAACFALENLRGNQTAISELARGFGTGAQVRYFKSGDKVSTVGSITNLSAEFLGPPRNDKFLSRMSPPVNQRFLAAADDQAAVQRPFPALEIHEDDADYEVVRKQGQPIVSKVVLRRLQELTDAPEYRLALTLDGIRNNTSLVILFRYRGRTLLFPGDAQWGSWQSWIGTESAAQKIASVDFLKVAHHGSENATPVDVVHDLKPDAIAAMVSTQTKPFPTIPRMQLLKELQKHCVGHVAVRSDWIDVKGAVKCLSPKPALPSEYTVGDFWIDYEF
jgi:beta-lactamase superfamily II metal-dependent hydrolase